jgi:hypothetical protein
MCRSCVQAMHRPRRSHAPAFQSCANQGRIVSDLGSTIRLRAAPRALMAIAHQLGPLPVEELTDQLVDTIQHWVLLPSIRQVRRCGTSSGPPSLPDSCPKSSAEPTHLGDVRVEGLANQVRRCYEQPRAPPTIRTALCACGESFRNRPQVVSPTAGGWLPRAWRAADPAFCGTGRRSKTAQASHLVRRRSAPSTGAGGAARHTARNAQRRRVAVPLGR